jgi:hypothetical protein
VSHDKVSIKQLNLKLVTGMTMFVEPSRDTEGALVAKAVIDGQFLGKNHVSKVLSMNVNVITGLCHKFIARSFCTLIHSHSDNTLCST